jgi:hypothetical protein
MDKTIKQVGNTDETEIVKAINEMGGEIVITDNLPDRSRDRVFTNGIDVKDYMSNPILVDSHNIRGGIGNSIGRTIELKRQSNMMSSVFELRPAANEYDPQNIVLLLWREKYINASSIQFLPTVMPEENEFGGLDFLESVLLEVSLVLVPDNPNAVRMAYDGMTMYGKNMLCGLDEVCKSGQFSDVVIKSLMDDLKIKKFPVKQDLYNKKDATDKEKEADKMIVGEDTVMGLDEINHNNHVLVHEVFKSFNLGKITKNQDKYLINTTRLNGIGLNDQEIDSLLDVNNVTLEKEVEAKENFTPKKKLMK